MYNNKNFLRKSKLYNNEFKYFNDKDQIRHYPRHRHPYRTHQCRLQIRQLPLPRHLLRMPCIMLQVLRCFWRCALLRRRAVRDEVSQTVQVELVVRSVRKRRRGCEFVLQQQMPERAMQDVWFRGEVWRVCGRVHQSGVEVHQARAQAQNNPNRQRELRLRIIAAIRAVSQQRHSSLQLDRLRGRQNLPSNGSGKLISLK